jgi:hypothetical protein
MSGADAFGHFDLEDLPSSDEVLDEALEHHRDAVSRENANYFVGNVLRQAYHV